MTEIIETKCTECEFVDQLFSKICSKYNVVMAADVKPLTFEDKKRIIELIFRYVNSIIIEWNDDPSNRKRVIKTLKQVTIAYELLSQFAHRKGYDDCEDIRCRNINHKFIVENAYYKERELIVIPTYEEDKNYSITEYEECKHCGSFITKFLCCVGIGTTIFTIIKIIAALV